MDRFSALLDRLTSGAADASVSCCDADLHSQQVSIPLTPELSLWAMR